MARNKCAESQEQTGVQLEDNAETPPRRVQLLPPDLHAARRDELIQTTDCAEPRQRRRQVNIHHQAKS